MSLLDFWDWGIPLKRRKIAENHFNRVHPAKYSSKHRHRTGQAVNSSIGHTDVKSVSDDFEDDDHPEIQREPGNLVPEAKTKRSQHDYGIAQAEQESEQSPNPELEWGRGKSSIYVDAFNLALETVLAEEAHLFDEAEMEVFRQWRNLAYEAQYLYVRLFLRKTSSWFRINRLAYSDITDLSRAVADLRVNRGFPFAQDNVVGSAADDMHLPNGNDSVNYFRFAEETHQITTLEEASSLLSLEELKMFAKRYKIQGKTKRELLEALSRSTQTQTGLSWGRNKGCEANRSGHIVRKILNHTGDCIKLASGPQALFERVHLVYYRSTEWTEKSLSTIILATTSHKNFPEYVVCRTNSIFPSRNVLLEFESALRIQFEVDSILEQNGAPTTETLQRVRELSDQVYPRWKSLVEQEQQKEQQNICEAGEDAYYLRLFSPASVYTRIIHKGLLPLARLKEHKVEHDTLVELLNQRFFHAARRGSWYQRKAVIEEHYMWALMPFEGRSNELQMKHWRKAALRTCEDGLEDPSCHLVYHYELQKRITKLEKSLRVVKREQHDFGYAALSKPEERIVKGTQIRREEPMSVQNDAKLKLNGDTAFKRGQQTVWVDGDGVGECRVESMCLNWYKDNGWKGYHSEGGIVRTLFAYLFYDILFTPIPNAFQTPFQTHPLDLHTEAFYPARATQINHRLAEISNGASEHIICTVHSHQYTRQPCVIGLDWSVNLDDLAEIAQCFRGEALAAMCKVLAQEYRQRGSGVPDLFLWDVRRGEVMFVEVKSGNDRLGEAQRLWIDVLLRAGVRVELCHAVAGEVRKA